MNFSHKHLLMTFHWSLSGSKFLQTSWTLLRNQVDLNNAVIWIISILPLISYPHPVFFSGFLGYYSNCANFRCYPRNSHFSHLFSSLAKSKYSYIFSLNIIIIIYSLRIFHISVNWWYFFGVWVTASLLKSPGLFSIFWPPSIMQ